MKLSEIDSGKSVVIVRVGGNDAIRQRLTEMGFVRGKRVVVIKNAPLKDPIEYEIMGYNVSLRRLEASEIEVTFDDTQEDIYPQNHPSLLTSSLESSDIHSAYSNGKNIKVVLIGNPNCGKTSLFNYISGLNEHVGNYSGVTVEQKNATITFKDYDITISDLPGTYSLTSYSPEERYVRNYLHENAPDVVINVIDASNIERNMYLTTQLIDMGLRVVVSLNMYDELLSSGDKFDYKSMGDMLKIPFIPTIAKKGKGVAHILDKIVDLYNSDSKYDVKINYGVYAEDCISKVEQLLMPLRHSNYSLRFTAIKLLEDDKDIKALYSSEKQFLAKVDDIRRSMEKEYNEPTTNIFADARYGFISGALKETYTRNNVKHKQSETIDNVVTNKVWGFPIFILIMWVIFYATFSLGEYPMAGIEYLISLVSEFLSGVMPKGAFKDLLINGIIGGIGSVVVFLPNILLLFLFISVLEDSGYMARAAFIMDKLMHKMGLHGKSFIPLVMGFGCNVPAIMASRIIESKNNRILTILITPFMSCSARLPVYILITGAFFPENAGNILFAIYIIGILLAIVTSLIFKRVLFNAKENPFVMELPPYRVPSVRGTIKHMWLKAYQYLSKMGGVILVAVVVIWTLSYYPRIENSYNTQQKTLIENKYNNIIEQTSCGPVRDSLDKVMRTELMTLQQTNSYIGRIGRFIEPALRPLGFDWKIGVGLLSGIAAKEIIISTMGVINQVDPEDPQADKTLEQRLKTDTHSSGSLKGELVFNKVTAFSFLMFVLIYFPCIAVISAIKKETGNWKWALLTVFYTTSLAWLVSFVIYQLLG